MSTADTEHRTCVCPAEPEVHCHACTKHERDERLREAREYAAWHRENDGLDLIVRLDDEVTRLDAVVTAVREIADRAEALGDAVGNPALANRAWRIATDLRALDGGAR